MFFSVIIPIYNVDRYLVQCVESIIEQRMVDAEVILVDDGSTDNSSKICDMFAKKHSNIIVIHKKKWRPFRCKKCRSCNCSG